MTCRMLEVYAEPKEALEDVAMAQWEEASVITVRGNVRSAGSLINFNLHSAAVLSSAGINTSVAPEQVSSMLCMCS